MAEFLNNASELVALNNPIIFSDSIPCNKGYIYHEDGTGIFILKGIVNNQCANFARYQVTYNGNIGIPTGGTAGVPIAVAITVNGEPRPTSRAIYFPGTTTETSGEYGNVTSTAIINVPRGCCFSVSVRAVAGSDDATITPAPTIEVINSNLVINRIA